MQTPFDIAVIGGGIVGCATARALAGRASVVIVEAEPKLAFHQTGRNSGVIHSGLYYRPGSAKARTCAAGRLALEEFCGQNGIPYQRCGKLVAAGSPEEIPLLGELERRGRANGLAGIRLVGPEEATEREPHLRAVAALLVPETGIVDFAAVTAAFAREVRDRGGEVVLDARVGRVARDGGRFVLETTAGPIRAGAIVNCAGLQSDRVARLCGVDPDVRIIPFRGEYHTLRSVSAGLVRHLIYPVPDPRFPFLGVHFTRRIGGGIEAGPNAVLALGRHAYRKGETNLRDLAETLAWPGFWRLAVRFWRTGLSESWRSWSKAAFARALARLVPEVTAADLSPGGSGIRAQAVGRDGTLLDDFHIVEAERQIHVLNAPSPAATASLAIGREIAAAASRNFGMG